MKPEEFSRAYYNLQRYVYRHGPEGELAVLMPMEYHANVSELVQMLQKGHHGVQLTDEEWDRIIAWIDLNVPFYGSWADTMGRDGRGPSDRLENRRELLQQYAGVDWQLEPLPEPPAEPVSFVLPSEPPATAPVPALEGWPMAPERAVQLQRAVGEATRRVISFGDGQQLQMVWIPAGTFLMGSMAATPDERPVTATSIEEGFWMSATEISNSQYRLFDRAHHSRFFSIMQMNTSTGRDLLSMNEPDQPVVRVSWQEAQAFCEWLSEQTGEQVDLPTEAQWEWACRAGSDTEFPSVATEEQGDVANCAGVTFGEFYDRKTLTHRLFDESWDDGIVVTEKVGAGKPNAWGLCNMHGNVAEWTRSLYGPYPYRAGDGRNDPGADGKRVVRGGSFSDRPKRCTASYRLGYQPWQGVYNVGFRVIIRPRSS
jgi:formylglycine-generating enzyme required for sulfatase activity